MILTAINRVLEKSTHYYYFLPDYIDRNTEAEEWLTTYLKGKPSDNLTSKEIKHIEKTFKNNKWLKTNKNEEEEKSKKYSIGTLIVITDYGNDNEPQKNMWNGSRGEVRGVNTNGTYKISITDVKDSQVMFSKKWVGREDLALKQRFTLTTDEFKTPKEAEAEAAEAEAKKAEDEAKAKEAEKEGSK